MMHASSADGNQERWRDYQRQQERLKAMATKAEKMKPVTADAMIENLFKQNFANSNVAFCDSKINSRFDYPAWLECDSPSVPEVYKHLWSLVKTSSNFADTQKVSQLLLTSGLQVEALGFIWNIANQTVPGHLNKQEFFVVLALVGLAQAGYSFNNISVLNTIQAAPFPTLQAKILEKCVSLPSTAIGHLPDNGPNQMSGEDFFKETHLSCPTSTDHFMLNNTAMTNMTFGGNSESGKHSLEIKSSKQISKLPPSRELFDLDVNDKDLTKIKSNFPCIGSSPTAELEDEDDFSEFQTACINEQNKDDSILSSHSDEFTDFQCADIGLAPLETAVINQKKEIPKIPIPKDLTGKLSNLRSNILKISPESEKKLKVLSQSESLSSLPESKISANNKVSTMPNITVLGGSRDIGMRLAHHSLGFKLEKSKQQKHQRHKQSIQDEDNIFPPKFITVDELFPKCFQKSTGNAKTFVLKETKINTIETRESELPASHENDALSDEVGKNTRQIEIPMLGTFNETILPTQLVQREPVELFSIEEDKYSALREVELEIKTTNNSDNVPSSEGIDDFGEFLSAELPSAPVVEDKDLWGEWNDPTSLSDDKICENCDNHKSQTKSSNHCEKDYIAHEMEKDVTCESELSFDLLRLNEEDCDVRVPGPLSQCETELGSEQQMGNNFQESLLCDVRRFEVKGTESNFVDFNLLYNVEPAPSVGTSNSVTFDAKDGVRSDEDFGAFFTTDFDVSPTEIRDKQSVVQELQDKGSKGEPDSQGNIRAKCLEACLKQMQEAQNIFNGISTKSVLEEVFSTQEAVDYLNCLNIMYQISKRISSHGEISYFQSDIEKIWQRLINYCDMYDIPLKENGDEGTENGDLCNLCCGYIGRDGIHEGVATYHPSCANLWVNCVDSQLPCHL